MADSSSTTHAITRAAHASLNLVSSSAELLSLSQLLATRTELKKTLAVVNDRVQAKLSVYPSVTIDLTDCDNTSDEENNDGNDTDPDYIASGSDGETGPAPPSDGIPGPYPMTPPNMDEVPDFWYVVDRGTEVGIFANGRCAEFALAGVVGGHKVRVPSWLEAVTLYNELHHRGNIIRVPYIY